VSFLTIPAKSGPSAFELLGFNPFGKTFYDEKQTAHDRYGVSPEKGAVVVLRPDGWVGTMIALGSNSIAEMEVYFKAFLDI